MKKTLLAIAFAAFSMAASAQTLYLSTYNGSNLKTLNGVTRNVMMNRAVFHGWNTISLPFSMTEAQVNEYFGSDCRLEMYVGLETSPAATTMLFQDVKAEGIKANVPYILYYNGESTTVKINAAETTIYDAPSSISYTNANGQTVTMAGTQSLLTSDNRYGVLVKNNDEATFVNVSTLASKFFATHCYVTVTNFDEADNSLTLATRHLAASDEATSISSITASSNEIISVYNEAGQLVAANIKASQFNDLKNGLYIVKGKKVIKK